MDMCIGMCARVRACVRASADIRVSMYADMHIAMHVVCMVGRQKDEATMPLPSCLLKNSRVMGRTASLEGKRVMIAHVAFPLSSPHISNLM